MIHLNGEFGSRQNIKVAIQLLTKACEKSTSYPEAPYTLGLLLLNDYPSVKIPKYDSNLSIVDNNSPLLL